MSAGDPRPIYAAATEWVSGLMAAVPSSHLDAPTPCPDFDVIALSGHLRGTALRAVALADGTNVLTVSMTDRIHDADFYRATVQSACELWSDDALLDTPVTAPWGVVPGAGALWGFVNETLVHGWDLAVATGQDPEAPPGLAEAMLPVAHGFIGEEMRGPGAPFAAAVPGRAGAGPTEILANWNGRGSADWVTDTAN